MASSTSTVERDNVVRKKDGLYIVKSQRSDGSWRKERKVKEGYVPPDEVPVYKTKQRMERETCPKYPPGLSEENLAVPDKHKTKSQKKNEKRREKKKLDALKESQDGDRSDVNLVHVESEEETVQSSVVEISRSLLHVQLQEEESRSSVEQDNKDYLKRVRQLRKKLKQIDDLQSRIDSGELANPDPDQLTKISRREELVTELLALGVDYDNMHS